jgi:fucose permease
MPSPVVLVTAPFAVGAAIGIIVPTSLALGGERLGGNAGTLFGPLLTFAQIGGMTLPAVVGGAADRMGHSRRAVADGGERAPHRRGSVAGWPEVESAT